MIEKPNIKWIGSPYFGYPRGARGRTVHNAIAIVDHIMAGSLSGTDAWFNSAGNDGTSAHFGVGKNGEIHQYVNLGDVSRHAGNVRNSTWPLLKYGNISGSPINPNWYTVGIEHEGHPGEEFPEAQYQATLQLHRWLIEEMGIVPGSDTIIGHYRIDSVNKANCPGPTFPWERLLGDLMEPEQYPFAEDVQLLVDRGIISSPDYWLQNAQAGKMCKGEYMRQLILNMVKYLRG
jgi:N-acetyl-anhydromuramyl-L-alanine amidase AmpD